MTLQALLAAVPDLVDRTLDQHHPDERGRCAACRDTDTGSEAAARWPCMAYDLAEQARALQHPLDGPPGRHAL
jgi:hypothetical protein